MYARDVLCSSLLGLLLACQKLGDPLDDPGHAGSSQAGGNAGDSAQGGRSGGAGAGGSSGGGGSSGATVISAVLGLDSATAHLQGRRGNVVRFELHGTQAVAGQAIAVSVVFADAGGNPVLAFDSDWDGEPDSDSGRIVFDAPVVDTTFSSSATLEGVPISAAKATIAVLDGTGASTPSLSIDVAPQLLKQLGQSCDPELVQSRCEIGESCSGTPSVCTAGVEPALEELRYLRNAGGPVLLARGTDPDDDMATLHLEFMNTSGQPVPVDLDNDGVVDSSSFDIGAPGSSKGGSFFVFNQSAAGFELRVPRISATPVDGNGNMGSSRVTDIANAAIKTAGLVCDARGFNVCAQGSTCAPGIVDVQNMCVLLSDARAQACAASPVLDPSAGLRFAAGRVNRMGLWDAPPGCVPGDAVGLPDTTLVLHLANAASTLTVTTARPETSFDTALYLLPGCPTDTNLALACNDDQRGYTSSIVMHDVPAGNYLVVVESLRPIGGSFGVEVTVE